MSREVMGSGTGEIPVDRSPGEDEQTDLDHRSLDGPAPARRPSLLPVGVRAAAAVGAVVLVAGLAGAGAAVQLQRAGDDRTTAVVAWLDYDDGGSYQGRGSRVGTRLNVVNTGDDEITVTDVDFAGGLRADQDAGVSGVLAGPVTVAPGAHAVQDVVAEVQDCGGGGDLVAPSADADGRLRVSVTGTDSRSAWVDGTTIGGYPISARTIREMACWTNYATQVVVEETSVRPDGRLSLRLRSTREDDVEVELRGPDGTRFVGEPALPVTVPGGGRESITVAVELEVDTCSEDVRRLDAVDQVRFRAGDEDVFDFDYVVMSSWLVREVTRACG